MGEPSNQPNPYDWRERLKHLEAGAGASDLGIESRPAQSTAQTGGVSPFAPPQSQERAFETANLSSGSAQVDGGSANVSAAGSDINSTPGSAESQAAEDLSPDPAGGSIKFSASRKSAAPQGVKTKDGGGAGGGVSHAFVTEGVGLVDLTDELGVRSTAATDLEVLRALDSLTLDKMSSPAQVSTTKLVSSIAGMVALAVFAMVSLSFNIPELVWLRRLSYLLIVLGIPFVLNEAVKLLLRKSPLKAQQFYARTSIGPSLEIAQSYMDVGDFLSAETILEKAVKKMRGRQARRAIAAYGLLGVIHAHTGRSDQADQMVSQALDAAESLCKASPTDTNAALLAMALNYTGELAELKGDKQTALDFYRRAAAVVMSQLRPSARLLAVVLSNVGHAHNALGNYQYALVYLTSAHELTREMSDAKPGQLAYVLSSLGTAFRGLGEMPECQDSFGEALTLTSDVLGQRQRGRVTFEMAKLYVAAGEHGQATSYFDKAVAAYECWKPQASPEFLRVLGDYAYFLRSIDQVEKADTVKKRAQQMQQTLRDINALHQTDVKKLNIFIPPKEVKKPRFPIGWSIAFGFTAYTVFQDGLRVAPPREWGILFAVSVVLGVKLKHWLSPPSRQELPEGLASIIAVIPFVRSMLPELSALSKRSIALIVVLLFVVTVVSRRLLPAPDVVPDGLTSFEYLVLGKRMAKNERFDKARDCLERVAKLDPTGYSGVVSTEALDSMLPKNSQSEDAIDTNLDAIAAYKAKNSEGAEQLWKECQEKYPDFEFPLVHLAEIYTKDKKLDEAESLLKSALKINPDCTRALIALCSVKIEQDKLDEAQELNGKASKFATASDDTEARLETTIMQTRISAKLRAEGKEPATEKETAAKKDAATTKQAAGTKPGDPTREPAANGVKGGAGTTGGPSAADRSAATGKRPGPGGTARGNDWTTVK